MSPRRSPVVQGIDAFDVVLMLIDHCEIRASGSDNGFSHATEAWRRNKAVLRSVAASAL